jgi:hypothetical protein
MNEESTKKKINFLDESGLVIEEKTVITKKKSVAVPTFLAFIK